MKLSDLTSSAASGPVGAATPQTAEEPWGVVRSTTPSGLDIYYQAGPKRLYTLASLTMRPTEVPSASTVLEVLEKGGLSWWGMKVGIQGVQELLRRGTVDRLRSIIEDENGVENVVELLKREKLTVNHVKGAAADRGTNVHTALELYAETGTLPNPENYPESEAGYVRGLVAFLTDTRLEVEMSEVMVASTAGYAGRFDCVGRLPGGKAVTKTYPKRSDIVDVIDPTWRFLLDLKTSKGVYPSYHIQLGGYEGGLEECGYGSVDVTAVVRVTSDGRYELVFGRATQEDFLAVLDVYRLIKRIEGKS